MKPGNDREKIDAAVMALIEVVLHQYGVPKEKVFECYDRIRFYVEARAVLLNRVPDRDNEAFGYYGGWLKALAQCAHVAYEPEGQQKLNSCDIEADTKDSHLLFSTKADSEGHLEDSQTLKCAHT